MNEISLDDNTNLASEFLLTRSMLIFHQIYTLDFLTEAVPILTPRRWINLYHDYGVNLLIKSSPEMYILRVFSRGHCPRNNVQRFRCYFFF